MNRRQYLASLATLATAGLAGCTSSGDSTSGTTAQPTDASTPTQNSPTAVPSTEPPATSTSPPTTTQTTAPPSTEPPTTTTSMEDLLDAGEEELKADAETVPYDELFRNFDEYAEERPVLHYEYGQVYQVLYDSYSEGDSHVQLYVATQNDEWEGDIAARWQSDPRLLEGDLLELWGVPWDLYEYETTNGDVRTIPRLWMLYADIQD